MIGSFLCKGENMETKDLFKEYKENICIHCIHHNTDYNDCDIRIKIDGEAGCVNYSCSEYERRKNNEEN